MYAYKHIHFYVYLAIIVKEIINCEGMGKMEGRVSGRSTVVTTCSCVKFFKKKTIKKEETIYLKRIQTSRHCFGILKGNLIVIVQMKMHCMVQTCLCVTVTFKM